MNWKLKDILMVGVIAALLGIVYFGLGYVGTALAAILTPFGLSLYAWEIIYGVWFMAAPMAAYIIQKKMVGTVAEMLAALIEVLVGSVFGPIVFLNGFIQGFGYELGFVITGYKKYNLPVMLLGSTTCAIASFIYNGIASGYFSFDIGTIIGLLVVRIISSCVFCGFVTKFICDGLAKAGVLNGYALGMKQKQPTVVE